MTPEDRLNMLYAACCEVAAQWTLGNIGAVGEESDLALDTLVVEVYRESQVRERDRKTKEERHADDR